MFTLFFPGKIDSMVVDSELKRIAQVLPAEEKPRELTEVLHVSFVPDLEYEQGPEGFSVILSFL